MRQTGTYKTLGALSSFVPYPLPPSPPLEWNPELMSLYGEASFSLGQLNEMSLRLPDPQRFIKAYVMKEALLSSAIEGIHTTLVEVLTSPLKDSKPNKSTQLVLNYTQALDVSFKMMREDGLPLVSRVILAAHKTLMGSGEGDKASPGLYRKQSVRVGEFVPPLAPEIPELMRSLESYINEPSDLPPLIKAGLAHVQFETIHPFLDGNGRIGRLLIVLMLIDSGLLDVPILYPSFYFKKHHGEYYQSLDRVRTHGDFEGWIAYYLRAIRDSALDAHLRAKEIEALEMRLKELIRTDPQFKKMRETAMLTLDFFFSQPIAGVPEVREGIGRSYNATQSCIQKLMSLGLITENKAQKRHRLYRFDPYLELLEKQYL